MLVEVGKSEISPSFDSILKLLFVNGEHLAFAPDTDKTRLMLDVLSSKFPLLKVPCRDYLLLSYFFLMSVSHGTGNMFRVNSGNS